MDGFSYEITGGDSLSFDGVVRLAGVTVWAARITTVGAAPKSAAGELDLLRCEFAEHLADVLSRPRPYCDCPHGEFA